MRYIANGAGYLLEVSFGAMMECNGQECTEYTGDVPAGYSSMVDWFAKESDNLYRWKIVAGSLVLDEDAQEPVYGYATTVQLSPEFAESIEGCTDPSKLYVLPDGYIYACFATKTEGGTKPNFTNLMDNPNSYTKNGYRYSHSSAAFKAQDTDCAVVVPIPSTAGSFTIRVRGASAAKVKYHASGLYLGTSNQSFTFVISSGAYSYTVESNGDIKIVTNASAYSGGYNYIVFNVDSGVNTAGLIVTVNEEITYTTTEGGVSYQWANTGHAFVPANYEARILAVEAKAENNAEKIAKLSNVSAGGSTEPNFTNLMDDPNAYIKDGYRYSHSSAAFKAQATDCAVVVPIPSTAGSFTIRVRGASASKVVYKDSGLYLGKDNQSFTYVISSGAYTYTVEADGDIKIVTDASAYSGGYNYIVFDVDAGVNKANLIVTVNEEIETPTNVSAGGGEVTMYIAPTGDDANNGTTESTPKKTVRACIEAGATRISAKRGVYNEAINLRNLGTVEIFPTDNAKPYVVGAGRPVIVFDTSDKLDASSLASYNSIKRIAYNNAKNSAYDNVFVQKTIPPVGSASQSSYNAALWLFSDDEKTVCRKPKPVLTIAACEAETNTFCYSGGYIYVNADLSGVTKIVVPTIAETGFYVNSVDKLVLCEVEVRFSGEYAFDLQNCAFVDLYKCSSKYTTRASGFHPVNTNGVFRACYATKCFDGFAPNGHGHTTFIDCVSEYNFDDGMSHHSGTEGTVIGGRYEGNGKGGNTPAYGAKVNIYGGLYRNNAQFGIGYVGDSDNGYVSGLVQNAVLVNNPVGLLVQANCEVTAMDCKYVGNTKDKNIQGTLTEY